MTRQQYNSMYGGGKKKGGGGLSMLMGMLGGGGTAAVNPEVANLAKYGELGNIASDASLPQFVPSGHDIMGQSSGMADELNNRMYMSQVQAKYNDTLARNFLPEQTAANIKQSNAVNENSSLIKAKESENAKQSKGEDYYRGLESLSDPERQMMFPDNPEVMWEDFGKLAGRMDTTYPQVAQEGLRGVLAKLPEQRAGFNFNTSPEGQAMLTGSARAKAGRAELDNRIANRILLSNGSTYERTDSNDPYSPGIMFEGRRDITSEENVALPQTQFQIDAKAPVEYTKMQRHTSVAPNITARGRTMKRTEDEYDAFRNSNENSVDTDYNQAIRAQSEAQQPAGISGTPAGDKAPPPVVVSAQPQVTAQPQPQQQYEGILPSTLGGAGNYIKNAANKASKLAAPAISAVGSDLSGVGQDINAMSKMLIRPKGETIPFPLNKESAIRALIMKAPGAINQSLAEIIQGISPNTVSGDAYPLPTDRPKKFPKSMKTKKTPLGLNTKLKDS